MTREKDVMLGDPAAGNKKIHDMKARVERINKTMPQAAVSIHQNSYGEEYVNGAQVFYYNGSVKSKELAEMIQNRMIQYLDPENHRQAKANDSYYLLKKTGKPIVIVECGFLSNSAEAEKLCDNYYQEKVAWNIHMSIMQYLNTREK